ncbi:OLC1v1010623C1 [Oldenlandia corymbosa var. corymbosa]|uniref:OLC1v1010623C1 n=1 Tax=Oldenlandia corymbosa var. corymbosa TaxID=529605 RepID=A0AAV1DRS2_OLDCO|nr:OLC1v1010623C1 [Oldenlandia corymbosa var. corymbosa]
MECHVISTSLLPLFKRDLKTKSRVPTDNVGWDLNKRLPELVKLNQSSFSKYTRRKCYWKIHCIPSLEEEFSALQSQKFSNDEEYDLGDSSDEENSTRPLSADELKALLIDSERSDLLKKLSDANQNNRLLKRQLQVKEDALVDLKSEVAAVQSEIQALVNLAEEISKYSIPEGSRKINGKYIQSCLFTRLEAAQEKLKELTKDIDAVQSKEVSVFWYGMAESVQVMGSFDNWNQGEELSQEYTGYQTQFSTTLMLRPGRYEIKFLVDGEWMLSPEYPTVGEGLMQNNLLVVG